MVIVPMLAPTLLENDSKTIHSPSFRQSIERKLDKVEIYASEEIVQSYFG